MGNSRFPIILFSLLFLVLGGETGHAQTPPPNAQPGQPLTDVTPAPEIPKQISTVILENNRLSVEFDNVSFGEIIQTVAQKAGIQIHGGSASSARKVTTKFTDLDLEEGIMRLFSLVKESNYVINYDANGAISKLDMSVRSARMKSSQSRPASSPSSAVPTAGFRPIQPPRSSRFNRLRQAPQTPAMPQTPGVPEVPQPPPAPEAPQDIPPPEASPEEPQDPQTGPVDNSTEHEQAREQEVTEIPYSPPQKTPIRIPAVTRRPGK